MLKQHFVLIPVPWNTFSSSLISFFALCATMMDCLDCRSECWQGRGGGKAGWTIFWWRLSNFTHLSTQDNKSSECTFNPESMNTVAWRIICFLFFFFKSVIQMRDTWDGSLCSFTAFMHDSLIDTELLLKQIKTAYFLEQNWNLI